VGREEESPAYVKDAISAMGKATVTGDKKMAEDVMAAFDRNAAIENAARDMDTPPSR
jgi:hypothetical protein